MADILIAQYKEKEFKRLTDYSLNLMSIIEMGLNPYSSSRGHIGKKKEDMNLDIWYPSEKEIEKLNEALLEMRSNILTSEERTILNEKNKLE